LKKKPKKKQKNKKMKKKKRKGKHCSNPQYNVRKATMLSPHVLGIWGNTVAIQNVLKKKITKLNF
jgi:hypothetical protein